MDLHNEAKATVTDMMQSGKTAGACGSLADSTIKEIDTSVNAAQKTLNVLPSGAACAKENKAQVDAAKKAADQASAGEAAAKKAADDAKKAPVTFKSATVMDIENGGCTAFYADPNYKAAKTKADTAAKTLDKKKGENKASQTALKDAQDAQKKAIHACACKAHAEHEKAVKAATAVNSAENKKAWDKSHMMKCVLAGTDPNACKVPPVPKAKIPALQEPAKSVTGCSHQAAPVSNTKIWVKYTTGTKNNAESKALEKANVHATAKGYDGAYIIPFHPKGKGGTGVTASSTVSKFGTPNKVTLTAGSTDGWYFTYIGVAVSASTPAASAYQKFCASDPKGEWLDGKPYDKASAYNGAKFSDSITLTPC